MHEKRTGECLQIFHSDQPSHGGDLKTFEVITSTCPIASLVQ